MPVEVRNLREDEVERFIQTADTAFLTRVDAAHVAAEVRQEWDLSRAWAAWDGPTLTGTLRSWATELTLPGGGRVAGSAIAGVTVRPTHRRRGILREMIRTEHAAIRERGEAVGLLHAAEYGIYGRFGYGPACRQAEWRLDALTARFRQTPDGTVEYVEPDEAVAETLSQVFDAWRLRQPGEIRRRPMRWRYDLGLRERPFAGPWKGFVAVHRDDAGEVDGYVRYHAEDKWEKGRPRGLLTVDELHALSPAAYAALWRFLAEIDLVSTVVADRRSPSEALPWLLGDARAANVEIGDGLWVRVFDVAAVLGTRRYERSGTLVLEVVDPEIESGRSRVALDAGPQGSTARATQRSADLTIDVSALSAAVLGGTSLRHAVLATGADEHRPGALAEADALLRTLEEPWCSTFF